MEESNNPLIVAIASVLLSIAAWAKNKLDVDGVKKDRAETKEKRDTDNALLNAKLEMMQKQFDDYKETTEKRLEAGDLLMKGFTEQFSTMNSNVAYIRGVMESREDYEKTMKEMNKNISELLNVMRSLTRTPSHTPGTRPV